MSLKILVVFTGGTIGSEALDGRVFLSSTTPEPLLLKQYRSDIDKSDNVLFTFIRPLNILSENLHPEDWHNLVKSIEEQKPDLFDGIIVTHGSDTLSFTSAFLSLYFHALSKPMLLVASNYPLEHPHANGLLNFKVAIEFIRHINEPNVFVSYSNTPQKTQIHYGSRLSACLPLSNNFLSIQSQPYMEWCNNRFQLLSANFPKGAPIPLQNKTSPRIQIVTPYPGLNYKTINTSESDVILHTLYHSGTACCSNQHGAEYDLLDFTAKCRKEGKPIYFAPIFQAKNLYASTRDLLEAGGYFIWNTSLESAFAKLHIAYGNFANTNDINRFLSNNIAGEMITPPAC